MAALALVLGLFALWLGISAWLVAGQAAETGRRVSCRVLASLAIACSVTVVFDSAVVFIMLGPNGP
jgi:hypothetical protein